MASAARAFICGSDACAAIPCTQGSCGALEVCERSQITASRPINDRKDKLDDEAAAERWGQGVALVSERDAAPALDPARRDRLLARRRRIR